MSLTNNNVSQKFYGLDHLRALAIIFVFLFHYIILTKGQPSWLPPFASFGWTGVDLFFVLSGFLISSQLFTNIKAGQFISFKTFFLKRFFRIIPAFWVTVAIYFCFPFFREKEALPPLWKFLTFTQNINLNIKDFGTFSHAWSLCVEEHFYLLLPLTLLLFQYLNLTKYAYWLLIVLFVSGLFIRIYCFDELYKPIMETENSWMYWYQYIYYPTYSRLDGLLAGVGIAAVYHFSPNLWSKLSKYGNLFIVASLGVFTTAYFLCADALSYSASVFGFPLVAIGFGFIVIGAISPTSFLYKWNSKITTYIASVSYAVYLTHKGIVHITHELLAAYNISGNWMLVICIVTCLIGASLLHITVEKPIMQWRKRALK